MYSNSDNGTYKSFIKYRSGVKVIKRIYSRLSIIALLAMLVSLSVILHSPNHAWAQTIPITFPVIGQSKFSDDFKALRSNGLHHATDIMANKRQGVVSAVDGVVTYAPYPEPSWGYMVTIAGYDGYTYHYVHLNNDNPGTDDGKGGGMHAYAPDIEPGRTVKKGQLIGWVGDSGNAENTPPHLHFEIYKGAVPINPYKSLRSAQRISSPVHYPAHKDEYIPYGVSTRLKANIEMGNLDSNFNTTEAVVGAGYGGGPHVKVSDSDNNTLASFFAYDLNFRGGVEVDTGDIDGDGVDEIITGAGKGGGPHVRIFNNKGDLLKQFFAYNVNDRHGVRASIGDVNGDGVMEVITAPLAGSLDPIKVFTLDGKQLSSFHAYGSGYKDGVDISVGDVNNDGIDEIVTGPGKGSGPHVRVFDVKGSRLGSFFVYNKENRGGVRVSVGDVIESREGSEISTVPATYGGPHVKVSDHRGVALRSNMFLESWWRSGYDVGSSFGTAKATAAESRRTTVRTAL